MLGAVFADPDERAIKERSGWATADVPSPTSPMVELPREDASGPAPQPKPTWRTWAWRVLGIAFATTGFVGAFVPGLPTTPFLLLAAACYTRGDPAARARLIAHPRFGPALKAWFDHGVVSRRAKVLAIVMMIASASFGIWIGGLGAGQASIVVAVIACVATWLALRPERAPAA